MSDASSLLRTKDGKKEGEVDVSWAGEEWISLDGVVGETTRQEARTHVNSRIGSALVADTVKGYNTCCFTFGNSPGKEGVVFGSADQPGLVRTVTAELVTTTITKADSEKKTLLQISMLALKDNKVVDLLHEDNKTFDEVCDDPLRGPVSPMTTSKIIESESDFETTVVPHLAKAGHVSATHSIVFHATLHQCSTNSRGKIEHTISNMRILILKEDDCNHTIFMDVIKGLSSDADVGHLRNLVKRSPLTHISETLSGNCITTALAFVNVTDIDGTLQTISVAEKSRQLSGIVVPIRPEHHELIQYLEALIQKEENTEHDPYQLKHEAIHILKRLAGSPSIKKGLSFTGSSNANVSSLANGGAVADSRATRDRGNNYSATEIRNERDGSKSASPSLPESALRNRSTTPSDRSGSASQRPSAHERNGGSITRVRGSSYDSENGDISIRLASERSERQTYEPPMGAEERRIRKENATLLKRIEGMEVESKRRDGVDRLVTECNAEIMRLQGDLRIAHGEPLGESYSQQTAELERQFQKEKDEVSRLTAEVEALRMRERAVQIEQSKKWREMLNERTMMNSELLTMRKAMQVAMEQKASEKVDYTLELEAENIALHEERRLLEKKLQDGKRQYDRLLWQIKKHSHWRAPGAAKRATKRKTIKSKLTKSLSVKGGGLSTTGASSREGETLELDSVESPTARALSLWHETNVVNPQKAAEKRLRKREKELAPTFKPATCNFERDSNWPGMAVSTFRDPNSKSPEASRVILDTRPLSREQVTPHRTPSLPPNMIDDLTKTSHHRDTDIGLEVIVARNRLEVCYCCNLS